jgi:hypothetical protein
MEIEECLKCHKWYPVFLKHKCKTEREILEEILMLLQAKDDEDILDGAGQ